MAIIDVYNKQRNVTYVYDSESYWDKDLKQPRSHRKLIGKRDPVTNEIIPTGRRGRKKSASTDEKPAAPSDTESREQLEDALRLIQEKDAQILNLRQELSAVEKENRIYRSTLQQASALLDKTMKSVDGK